jgi:hypothetical protein
MWVSILAPGDFTVHLHHPEDFLIIFSSRETFGGLSDDHTIDNSRFTLSIRPWCKLAHANVASFEYSVQLELRGIPAQAWHLSTAERLLGAHVGSSACTRTRARVLTWPPSGSPATPHA